MTSLRVSLLAVASVCGLLSACAGGSGSTGTAGTSGGGSAGTTGTAGTMGGAGTTGSAGTIGGAGTTGAAGTGATGTAGTTGGAGTIGAAGTIGTAGTTGSAGTAGSAGSSGSGGTTGTGGNGGRGGTGGGTAGTMGTAGRGGTTGSAGASGGSGGASSGFFTDNFESGTSGMQPSGWDNFIAYQAKGPNPNGSTLALVDTTRAHGGTKSVHFHGGSSPAQLTRALATGTNKLYVRAYVYFIRQLGGNTAVNGINHETVIGIRKTSGNAGDEVRFGETKGYIGTLDAASDDWSPKLATPTTAVVAPNRWACIEVAFLADQAQHTVYAWVDGTLVHSITSTPAQWEHGALSASWMTGKFGEVILGWQSFSNVDTDVWMDDIVLSNSPIGCN